MSAEIEAKLKALRSEIVDYIDAGADRNRVVGIAQGAVEDWFDALEAISGLVATEHNRSSEQMAEAVKANADAYAEFRKERRAKEAAEAKLAEVTADRDRISRNRDMWKGQVERQAEKLRAFTERPVPGKSFPETGKEIPKPTTEVAQSENVPGFGGDR